ncbi:MAG: CAP domain-containing protein [Candidatus Paceibacterota bacterium]|jgi:hypothetical protein
MIEEIFLKLKIVFIPVQENNFRPKFLDSNFLIYYLAILLVAKFAVLPAFTCFYQTSLFASITKGSLINLTNQERKYFGLQDLKSNPLLDQAAALKAQDMLNFDYFSHNSPRGKTPWYWIKLAGYDYQKAGENLAIGFVDGEEVVQAWKESPSHFANIINSGYEEMGIGIATGDYQGQEITVVVQMFGSKLKNGQAKLAVEAKTPLAVADQTTQEKKEAVLGLEAAGQNLNGSSLPEEEESDQNQEESLTFLSSESPSSTEPENKKSVASAAPLTRVQEIKPDWRTKAMQFFSVDYFKIIEKMTFLSLLAVMLGMMLNIFIKIRIQHKDLMLKGTFFMMVFGILLVFDKIIILRFIPHNLIIG